MGRPKKEAPNHGKYYEVKATITDAYGSKIRKSFYSEISKEDARRQAKEYEVAHNVAELAGEPIIDKSMSFKVWAQKWLETYKKGKVKEHTFNYTYKSNVDKYLIPYFGNMILRNIKQANIQQYFNEVKIIDDKGNKMPLAESTLDKHKIILKDIFEQAIDNDLCYKNPVKNISFTQNPEESVKRAYKLSESLIAEKYSMLYEDCLGIYIILNTGLRRSELIGLKWSDIDFKQKFIHIQRAVVPTKGKIVEGKPKSKSSNRIIPVSTTFLNHIKKYDKSYDYVISGNSKEQCRSPGAYAKQYVKVMKRLSKETGLPELTLHELRHTFGTVLREKGVDLFTIQKLMGHSSIKVTEIYVHNDIDVLRKSMKLNEKTWYKCRTSVVQSRKSQIQVFMKKKKNPHKHSVHVGLAERKGFEPLERL